MALFWLSLAVTALVLTVASAIYVTRRGLEAFRGCQAARPAVSARSSTGSQRRAREIERHLALAAESGAQLEASLARLAILARTTERPDSGDRGRARGGRTASPPSCRASESRRRRPRDELDAAARRGRRRRARRGRAPARDHAARRGRRRAPPAPAPPDRARAQRPLRLPPRARGARRRADARIATSAVRDAENGEAFLGEIEWSYGFTTRLLTGDEEAALTLRGIGEVEPGTLVVDIGGGSTELQVVGTEAARRASTSAACG